MTSDLKGTWNDAAPRYHDYGPPLKTSPEDILLYREALAQWHAGNSVARPSVFLCGVTPDIVFMDWPFPYELVGMDQAEGMVRHVWPGDVVGLRRGVVGDWLRNGLEDGTQDVVIGDGGFGFFSFPDAQRALLKVLCRLLRPGGLFIHRFFTQSEKRESIDEVLTTARAGGIGSFHAFKWRLAMAMQPDGTTGARQRDIWEAWTGMGIDPARMPQPGWSAGAVRTIDLYKGKEACLYFPTLGELRTL
jgi:hypothetical protein